MTPSNCAITLLRAKGPRLAKTLHLGGSFTPYGDARVFDMTEVTVASLGDLYGILTKKPGQTGQKGRLQRRHN